MQTLSGNWGGAAIAACDARVTLRPDFRNSFSHFVGRVFCYSLVVQCCECSKIVDSRPRPCTS